ncbi:MAG: ATP-binding protein, partial [Acidobacteriota bacterium]
IKSMLEHSRGGEGQVQPVDLNDLVGNYVNLAYHGLKSQNDAVDIDFDLALADSLPPVTLVAQEIGRVFLNLINNACHALTQKSERLGAGFSPLITVTTRDLGEAVEIRIRDNGDGIPDEIRDKVFNPFFTTKYAGEGTGLGLSLCYDIVVQGNGGTIDFESEEGSFTEFVVVLPKQRAA